MLNSCVLIGRLGADPELRYTKNSTAVGAFDLAVDRPRKGPDGNRQTDWLRIVAFGPLAENVARYCTKGSLVGVRGRIQTRSYEQGGQRRKVTEIVADEVQFLSQKPATQEEARDDDDVSAPF